MTRRNLLTSLSVDEAKAMIARGESRTDRAVVAATSEAQIRKQAADDPEEREWDWARATLETPRPKIDVHIKLDAEVVDYFKRGGAGYQTRINAALKAYVQHARERRA